MTSVLRPDEMERESEIRKSQGRTNDIRSGLQTAASLGTIGVAPKVAEKILPFLSQYIPKDLAFKGINKVMPALGSFLKNGMQQGLTLESGLAFIKDSFNEEKEEKEDQNIIQQYSPELFSFLDQEVRKGHPLAKASSEAQKKYKNVIQRMEKDHKTSFVDILEQIFGKQTGKQMALKKFNERKQGLVEQEQERFQKEYGDQGVENTPNQPQQSGQGQQALMAILQKINQRLGQ